MSGRIGAGALALCVAVLFAQCVYGEADARARCKAPKIKKLVPDEGRNGEQVTIRGKKFGDEPGFVAFYPGVAAAITLWSNRQIEVTVPEGAETGWVIVLSQCGKAPPRQSDSQPVTALRFPTYVSRSARSRFNSSSFSRICSSVRSGGQA